MVVTDEQVEIRYVFPTSPASEHIRFCHLRTDYFRAPHLIDLFNAHPTQQVGIVSGLWPWLAQMGLRIHGFQSHQPQ
jgi:hypothetical protein